MNGDPRKKPSVFRPSPEILRQFKDASPEAKLNWLGGTLCSPFKLDDIFSEGPEVIW